VPIRPENQARYPADWKAISERIRFDRAAGRCECKGECGTGHVGRCLRRHGDRLGSEIDSPRVILTTAHRDHVPEHCDDANLFAACQRCHLAYDREHHARTRAATRERRQQANTDPLF
jgi:hypothetical protein